MREKPLTPTPGPWKYYEGTHSIYGGSPDDPEAVCGVYGLRKGEDPEREANAQLIAAAPDLYESLSAIHAAAKSWHDFHHGVDYIQCDDICKQIPVMKAALAKALGSSREE